MGMLLLTFLLFGLMTIALALGILAKREPLQGSCGGIGRITGASCTAGCRQRCPNRRSPGTEAHATQRSDYHENGA